MKRAIISSLAATVCLAAVPAHARLTASEVALIINDDDPDSQAIGRYYQARRDIPSRNVIHVKLARTRLMSLEAFRAFKAQVDAALADRPDIQAIAMAWSNPSRIDCNSITWALTVDYAPLNPCGGKGMTTDPAYPLSKIISPYYDSDSKAPFTDYKMRISMMVTGRTVADAKAMIDRGIASDGTRPRGNAYIMITDDAVRNIRGRAYVDRHEPLGTTLNPLISVSVPEANTISNTTDTMFYFQGLRSVRAYTNEALNNRYPPGAVLDNLTSFACFLDKGANCLDHVGPHGATATYGTVSEPYAILGKFPDPKVMIQRYTEGDTVIEAYWKSVRVPFQGLFIGEPLAAPYAQPSMSARKCAKGTAKRSERRSRAGESCTN